MNGEDTLLDKSDGESKPTEKKTHRKGGPSGARQRYKMGKS